MSRFDEIAVWATRKIVEEGQPPDEAWSAASRSLNSGSDSMADKGCPRTTYLTLCGEGFVKGVVSGRYVDGRENAGHAVALALVLLEDSDLADASTNRLWKMAGGGAKKENDQVEVVVGLSRAGLLVNPPKRSGPA